MNKDRSGRGPIDIAKEVRQLDIVDLLEEFMGSQDIIERFAVATGEQHVD